MRRICLFLGLALLAASCGGRAAVYETPPSRGGAQERGVTLPDPIPATAAYVASSKKPLRAKDLERLANIDGVAVAAPMTVRRVPVKGPSGKTSLRVGEVDPLLFRSVAPASTRDAEFVWVSLIVGHAIPTFTAANKLGLEGSGDLTIAGTPGFRVGAFAENGAPNIADVIVQRGSERQLGLGDTNVVVVGAKSGVTIEALGRDLREALPDAKLRRLIPDLTAPAQPSAPAAPEPIGYVSGGVVGAMTFEILPGGFIRPDPQWVAANIVSASVPIIGTVTCHRLMIPRLAGALGEVEKAGLAHLIRRGEYGGCYVPRFIDRDPKKPLSNHAFGLAVDFNVRTNQLGTRGDMDPRIVEVFRRWGFVWGGHWARPDPMHFELTG